MSDLNFFESYNKKKDKNLNKDFILYGLAALVVLGMIVYAFLNFIKINRLTDETALLKQQLEIKKSNSKINEILEKEKEIVEFREKFNQLKQLDDFINYQDIINENLLDAITVRIPEAVFLNSMIFNTNLISIEGTAKDKESISDFEHKLGEIDHFDEIFIPAISFENDYYTFTINIKPKEVEEVGSQDSN
ncbi:PilN domain-containing protein [Proteiniborus sp. MB09-C3]|uniref:PilN domain-containing protein n=1 Tax=Proteiniborus sp. MB09-C3 TaxID=3050072 RepID=UPI0025549530|nr:PilN domain-containing protein [Proteiniborus sp. MB09-C3]WIV11014.1 PilN domain-containing protein [Proteiniborus sp. MB09-C3]